MRCNLNCYGCYAGQYRKESDMPIELLDRLFNEAEEMGMNFLTISGGEPFIRKEHLDLFEKHPDIAFQIYTNGTLINQEVAKRLAQMGNVYPAISVEGYEEETDETSRKRNIQKIMKPWKLYVMKECFLAFSIYCYPS